MRLHRHKWIKVKPSLSSPFEDGTIFWVCKRCKKIVFKDPKNGE